MKHILSVILLVIACSLYYFPVSLQALPSLNSKMVAAAIGLILFSWEHLKRKSASIRKDLFSILMLGLIFSLSSYFSVTYNSTNDMVYVSYFVSMCVWLGGAYCVLYLLRLIHGEVTLHTVFLYLGIMCAGQCVIAILIDNIPALANFVNTVFVGADPEYFEKNPRLYGIGAGFDTAGIRFSCVLLGLAYMMKENVSRAKKNFYILLFLIIGAIGNMISRTTVVGIAVACAYLFLSSVSLRRINFFITAKGLLWTVGGCAMLVLLYYAGIYMYNTMPGVHAAFDYGFEGFINLVETGRFSTHSSDLLVNSIGDILPDNVKTWIIGDGYFADPYDPNKFYMGTDMGYIRFVFYCGIIGLVIFLVYFICCTYVLCKRERGLKLFFFCLFVIQLIVWIKIPTVMNHKENRQFSNMEIFLNIFLNLKKVGIEIAVEDFHLVPQSKFLQQFDKGIVILVPFLHA